MYKHVEGPEQGVLEALTAMNATAAMHSVNTSGRLMKASVSG